MKDASSVMKEFARLRDQAHGGDEDAKDRLMAFRRKHRLYDEITLDDEEGEGGARTLSRSFTLAAALDEGGEARGPGDPEAALDAVASSVRSLCRNARAALLTALASSGREAAQSAVRRWAAEWQPRLAEAFAGASLAATLDGMASLAGLLEAGGGGQVSNLDTWVEDEAAGELPLVRNALARLASMDLLALPGYLAARQKAQAAGQAAAQQQADAVLTRVRGALGRSLETGGTLEGFRRDVAGSLGGTALQPSDAETVFRTNVMAAYSDGQEQLLSDPDVGDLFPFRQYFATHDSRTRPHHLAMETSGIQGSNIYLASDPVFQLYRPPSEPNCRCTWSPVSVAEAARRGIDYAKEWAATGRQPPRPPYVAMPAWRPHAEVAQARGVTTLSAAGNEDDDDVAEAVMRLVEGGGLSLSSASGGDDWQPYEGPRGGKGWRKGDAVVYGEDRPGGGVSHRRELKKAHAARDTVGLPPDEVRRRLKAVPLAPHQEEALDYLFGVGADGLRALSEAARLAHAYAATRVLSRMPRKAAKRLKDNVLMATFAADAEEATARANEKIKGWLKAGERVLGYWSPARGELVVDGATEHEGFSDPEETQRAVWSHEIGHAIDGRKYELSRSEEWRAVFDSEIKGGRLSRYATTSPEEGFAEFCRAVYGTDVPLEKTEAAFPKAAAFMRKRGLLP